ncbi:hypothetical protein ACWIUD_03480 [Helicobacter sp. 23-1044]
MKDKNYYPLGIAIFFGIMCCGILATIYISLKYKPDYDNAYFSTKQEVDRNINMILRAQNELEAKYQFFALNGAEKVPLARSVTRKSPPLLAPNALRYEILDSTKNRVIPQNSKVFITRFADSSANLDLGELQIKNGELVSKELSLKKGDWKVLVEFEIEGKKAYFSQRILVEGAESALDSAKKADSAK